MPRKVRYLFDRIKGLDDALRGIAVLSDSQAMIDSREIVAAIKRLKKNSEAMELINGMVEVLINQTVDAAASATDKTFNAGTAYGIRLFQRRMDQFVTEYEKRTIQKAAVVKHKKDVELAQKTNAPYGGV